MFASVMKSLLVTCVVGALGACEDSLQPSDVSGAAASARMKIVTTNYPLFFFTSQIVEDTGEVFEVILPDIKGDPAEWQPQSDDIALLQTADLLVTNGAGYERWLNWVSLPDGRILNSTENLGGRLVERPETVQHQHGPGGDHSHAVTASTTWLDPALASAQANAIAAALIDLSPEHTGQLKKNAADLHSRLDELDRNLERVLSGLDQPVLFSHPVYQYLQARYGINGVSLHWEPEDAPDTTQWIKLQQILRSHPATMLIWEDTPISETVDRLTDLKIRSVVFRPAAFRSESADYFEIMAANADRMSAAIAAR